VLQFAVEEAEEKFPEIIVIDRDVSCVPDILSLCEWSRVLAYMTFAFVYYLKLKWYLFSVLRNG
jgi:hypothetical protein